jgi:hypothetical protein
MSRHASPRGGFSFGSKCQTPLAHHALRSPACSHVSESVPGRMADAARVLQRLICALHREAATGSRLLTQSADGIFAVRADVAQLVEQRFRKPQVTGSNPVVGCPLFWISDGGLLGRSMLKNRLGHSMDDCARLSSPLRLNPSCLVDGYSDRWPRFVPVGALFVSVRDL